MGSPQAAPTPQEDMTLKTSYVSLSIQAFGTIGIASILDNLAALYADPSAQFTALVISKHHRAPKSAEPSSVKFARLAAEWKRDTRFVSVVRQKMTHHAYLKIIGMGKDALPFILKDLDDQPADWIPALISITEENPVNPDDSFEQAVKAWLKWGRDRDLL
jgi:hypothetical protein